MNQRTSYKELTLDGITYEQVREPEQGSPCDSCALDKGNICTDKDKNGTANDECLRNGTIWRRKDV